MSAATNGGYADGGDGQHAATNGNGGPNHHPDLVEYERRLQDEVDEDFFQDPKKFRTLHRVIDVLGAQLLDVDHGGGAGVSGSGSGQLLASDPENLHKNNPAYLALKRQQAVVEEAIEHMAVAHCSDLNSSVVAVGKVARQFNEAATRVRSLRRQVRDIKDNLGTGDAANANPNEPSGANGVGQGAVGPDGQPIPGGPSSSQAANAAASAASGGKSLRELWLKKLECEAVLSLLHKLEVVRRAPTTFDSLVQPTHGGPCRIGAAVTLLADALSTMFSDDVAQVQALHKIMEQLMTRKQRAEELIWDTLADVLYLRTGNAVRPGELEQEGGVAGAAAVVSAVAAAANTPGKGGGATPGDSKTPLRRARHRYVSAESPAMRRGQYGRSPHRPDDDGEDDDDDDDSDDDSLFSDVGDDQSAAPPSTVKTSGGSGGGGAEKGTPSAGGGGGGKDFALPPAQTPGGKAGLGLSAGGRTIPRSIVEADIDLEADEIRCLEDAASLPYGGGGSTAAAKVMGPGDPSLPRYADPVLALRILVEALAKLGRLDDIERVLGENVEGELRRIAQAEQMRTYARLERRRNAPRKAGKKRSGAAANEGVGMVGQLALAETDEAMRDFRVHLGSLLVAFGSVALRLSHLAQIVRHRISMDVELLSKFPNHASTMHSVLVTADTAMQREIKGFLEACLNESFDDSMMFDGMADDGGGRGVSSHERGIFSLGIVDDASSRKDTRQATSLAASRASIMELPPDKFVTNVLFPRTNMVPQVRHALTFRRSVATWAAESADLRAELAQATGQHTDGDDAATEEKAIDYLDSVIQKNLLPMLQEEAVNGTISALEREDAFEPRIDPGMYAKNVHVEMCVACQALYRYTGPLFSALHRLPSGGEMYSPLVAVLEHAILTFNSRVKQRVGYICRGKKAHALLDAKNSFFTDIELRKSYTLLMQAYFGEDDIDAAGGVDLSPAAGDAKSKKKDEKSSGAGGALDAGADVERERAAFELEVSHLGPLLDFTTKNYGYDLEVCNEDELAKAACLAHSLLKVASLLEGRLMTKSGGRQRTVSATRALRGAIKTIREHGVRMAKFCRIDMLIQTVKRMSKICKSSTLVAKDAVRLPSCVNDLGEHLTSASDVLREAGGYSLAAYSLSSLEQYIPLFLMQTVRIIAKGKGLQKGTIITLNGVEALDRSGSVLYRDLKGATSFENSFWDDEVAAESFERSASFVAMIELDMEELVSYCRNNRAEFSDKDYKLMFGMDGPRRTGDIKKYAELIERMGG